MIYLDHHATTPVAPIVLERMLPYFTEHYGNASSRQHSFGWRAEEAVEHGRRQVAKLIGGTSREILFTSGATESNNLALFGVAEHSSQAVPKSGKHIVTQMSEHKAVLDCCARLSFQGFEVTVLPVNSAGQIDLNQLQAALRADTILCSLMLANNEVGTIYPIAEAGKLCRALGIPLHCDATQAVGRIPVDVNTLNIDILSLSAHKFYGPKGVGALYVRRRNPRVVLAARQFGGGHERGLRSGTLNVPGIVGLGAAAALAQESLSTDSARITALRDHLQGRLLEGLQGVTVNGDRKYRLPGNLHITIDGVEGETMLLRLREVALSSGAACGSATLEPSHVMAAMGKTADDSHRSIRFGVGRDNTQAEIDFVAQLVIDKVNAMRA